MDMVKWDESLILGVEDIDADHQDLVACLNGLSNATFANDASTSIGPALQKLVDRAREHFRSEETLMARVDYPGLAAQRSEHETLLVSVLMFQQRAQEGGSASISSENLVSLTSWLVHHITDADKDFARFILRSQAAARGEPCSAAVGLRAA